MCVTHLYPDLNKEKNNDIHAIIEHMNIEIKRLLLKILV